MLGSFGWEIFQDQFRCLVDILSPPGGKVIHKSEHGEFRALSKTSPQTLSSPQNHDLRIKNLSKMGTEPDREKSMLRSKGGALA